MEKLDVGAPLHFVGHDRAVAVSEVAALATAAGFDDVRALTPGETGYYSQ
jgi:hypothetical protein